MNNGQGEPAEVTEPAEPADTTKGKGKERRSGGRPSSLRELILMVTLDDFNFLKAIESKSIFQAEEIARAFLHVGISDSESKVPDVFASAVAEAREQFKPDPTKGKV